MTKKKNYLNNEDLRDEILKCITRGYEQAISNGYIPSLMENDETETRGKTIKIGYVFNSDDPELIEKYNLALKNGYNPERSNWIRQVREFEKKKINECIKNGEMSEDDAKSLSKQFAKPVASDKLGKMFQLIVDNVARSFYWQNPDDGLDCKANALLDLCSGFWKYEPTDANGKSFSAFAFCSQIAYFGIAGAHRILHPKKYDGTISMSCIDENGKTFDLYNI